MLAALAVGLPLAVSACASREGANQAAARGMVQRDRELARTPDQLDLHQPAWQRDLSPAHDY